MLIYEKKDNGARKLFGTLGTAPSVSDNELTVEPNAFDFAGPYYYKAPGGIKDASGNDVTVSIDGTQIIPPVTSDMGEVDTNYDELDELTKLVDENDPETPDDTSDDTTYIDPVWTEQTLQAETKASILKMANLLGYEGLDSSMSKSAMITAFLTAQNAAYDSKGKPKA